MSPVAKPKRITRIQFHFHPGTKIDTRALRQCRASDIDVRIQGARACPKASRLGFATSRVTTGVTPPDQTQITFLNAPRQIIVLVRVEGRTLAVYRDDIKGRIVTVNLDLPSGLSLLELRATIKPHVKGRGKKRRVYFRTPACVPADRGMDDNRDLHVHRRIDAAARGQLAMPTTVSGSVDQHVRSLARSVSLSFRAQLLDRGAGRKLHGKQTSGLRR